MKISVIAVGYQCQPEVLNQVLSPWIELKQSEDVTICAVSALFKERWDRGETYMNGDMAQHLINSDLIIDKYIEVKHPILDFESRNFAWNYLKNTNPDIVWQLDLFDEYYNLDQIKNAIQFIKNNEFVEYFRVNFKNYFGKEGSATYVDDFCPTRVINNRVNGGLKSFYWDNEVVFENGVRTPNCSNLSIPKNKLFPKHLSWVGDKVFLEQKIDYQHRALGHCSYKYNVEKDALEFNDEFYKKNNLIKPVVYND